MAFPLEYSNYSTFKTSFFFFSSSERYSHLWRMNFIFMWHSGIKYSNRFEWFSFVFICVFLCVFFSLFFLFFSFLSVKNRDAHTGVSMNLRVSNHGKIHKREAMNFLRFHLFFDSFHIAACRSHAASSAATVHLR